MTFYVIMLSIGFWTALIGFMAVLSHPAEDSALSAYCRYECAGSEAPGPRKRMSLDTVLVSAGGGVPHA